MTIIKKYPNRRLYDTDRSRYITVADVRDLVVKGVDFKVIDANTNEDITRSVLLQIILEQENHGESIFTPEILSKIIRFYDNSLQKIFTSYLDQSLNIFVKQQSLLQKQLQDILLNTPPMNVLASITKQNLETWQKLQENFFKTAAFHPDSDKKNPK
ncbi:MAG: polyhydroxyalkanoate synthesis repressor PhaR [Methylobacter sp.]|nr:polyhydroxyalkanoate synthesis repressor PhaR [Methylobacter sp.]